MSLFQIAARVAASLSQPLSERRDYGGTVEPVVGAPVAQVPHGMGEQGGGGDQQAAPQSPDSAIDPAQVRQSLMQAYAHLVGGEKSDSNENTVGVTGAPFDTLSKDYEYSVFMNLDREAGTVDVFSTVHHDTELILQIPLKELARSSGLTKVQKAVMSDIEAAKTQFDETFPEDESDEGDAGGAFGGLGPADPE